MYIYIYFIEFVFEHPNFYTRYMDGSTAFLAQWDIWAPICNPPDCVPAVSYGWPPLHERKMISNDDTDEGWKRPGWWVRNNANSWLKGLCTPEYERVCKNDTHKLSKFWSLPDKYITKDTYTTYRPLLSYNDQTSIASGRWFIEGGECVDRVLRGCYNNGTCIGPDTCACAPGWTGFNCLMPVCQQNCLNFGNCTLPNICTCEKGWSGKDCSVPLCAQECKNGGICVKPDVCKCNRWPMTFYDKRIAGGRPLFQRPNGDPALTGWTGYDCSTPICTQASRFVLNDDTGGVRLGGYGRILYGDAPTNNLLGQPPPPPYKYTKTLVPGDGQVC